MECVLHAKLRNTGLGLVKDWTGKDKDTRPDQAYKDQDRDKD